MAVYAVNDSTRDLAAGCDTEFEGEIVEQGYRYALAALPPKYNVKGNQEQVDR